MRSPLVEHSQIRGPGAGTGGCKAAVPEGAAGAAEGISGAANFRGGASGVGGRGDDAAASAADSRGEGSKAAIPMAMAVVAAMSVPTSQGK